MRGMTSVTGLERNNISAHMSVLFCACFMCVQFPVLTVVRLILKSRFALEDDWNKIWKSISCQTEHHRRYI